MDSIDWLPSITTTLLLAGALWLGRNLIATRLTRSVEHEFDKKLESIRADLRSKEAEIAALRGGALNAMASRQIVLDKRRLEAVEQLWSAVEVLDSGRTAAMMMEITNFEEALKASAINAPEGGKVRKMYEMFGAGFDMKNIDLSDAHKAQPFVSAMAWALFSAYEAIIFQAALKVQIIKGGVGNKNFLNNDAVPKLLKAAFPDQAAYIDKYSDRGFSNLLNTLQERLLNELQKMLTGDEADAAILHQAGNILKQSKEIMDAAKKEENTHAT